jgi:4-hydroxybenzoate polyprenyltransferase
MRQFGYLITSLRPRQWTKNLLVFAALVFALRLDSTEALLRAIEAFLLFCAGTGGLYLLNDLIDLSADQAHPTKRLRPLASGKLNPLVAIWASGVLIAGSLALAVPLGSGFLASYTAYIGLVLAYNLGVKRIPIAESLVVALGFLIRAVAGALVISVEISSWFLVCTFFLALLLVLGKRRVELVSLPDSATHRAALAHYTSQLLDQYILIAATGAILTYCLYTFAPQTLLKFPGAHLELTIPLVVFGVFRYLWILYTQDKAGAPEEVLITDRPILVNLLLFLVVAVVVIYWR